MIAASEADDETPAVAKANHNSFTPAPPGVTTIKPATLASTYAIKIGAGVTGLPSAKNVTKKQARIGNRKRYGHPQHWLK